MSESEMGASLSKFQYSPLEVDEIRVLRFEKGGKVGRTIKLRLEHIKRPSGTAHDAERSPPYYALSYAWGGDGQVSHRIRINKSSFVVSETLHEILRTLQSDPSFNTPSFLLWVDAICINQADEDEKSIQVLHMRETYKDACQVIVSLGDYPEQRVATGRVASFLSEHLPPIPDGMSYVSAQPDYLVDESNTAVVYTLCQHILRRPWWWRMWVIQEVALARSIVVLCDGHRLSWEHLVYVTQWIRILNVKFLSATPGALESENSYGPNIHFKAAYRHQLVFGGAVDPRIREMLRDSGGSTPASEVEDEGTINSRSLPQPPVADTESSSSEAEDNGQGFERTVKPAISELSNESSSYLVSQIGSSEIKSSKQALEEPANRAIQELSTNLESRLSLQPGTPDSGTSKQVPSSLTPHLPILELLNNATACQAGDPKDMIYSLLGLATDIQSSTTPNIDNKLVVDYKRRTVPDVYIDLATVHIRTHDQDTLDVITFSRFDPHPKHSLPSWVPDWSNLRETACYSLAKPSPVSEARARVSPPYHYRASGTRRCEPDITPDYGLVVKGVRFDAVSQVGEVFEGGDFNAFRVVDNNWRSLVFGENGENGGDEYMSSGRTLREVFDRTISADTAVDGSRMTGEQGLHARIWGVAQAARTLRVLGITDSGVLSQMLADSMRGVDQAMRAVELRAVRRRFFVTSGGSFGLGPRNAQAGDAVFVLYGCSVPVVLRPNGKHWTLVGETFVAGIMDGEVVEGAGEGETITIK